MSESWHLRGERGKGAFGRFRRMPTREAACHCGQLRLEVEGDHPQLAPFAGTGLRDEEVTVQGEGTLGSSRTPERAAAPEVDRRDPPLRVADIGDSLGGVQHDAVPHRDRHHHLYRIQIAAQAPACVDLETVHGAGEVNDRRKGCRRRFVGTVQKSAG